MSKSEACIGHNVYIFCCDTSCLTPPQNSIALDTVHNSKLGTTIQKLGTRHTATLAQHVAILAPHIAILAPQTASLASQIATLAPSSLPQNSMQNGSGQTQSQLTQCNIMACRLAMDEPNLQCAPKAKDFLVPMTQMPGSSSKHAHRIHTCNIRYNTYFSHRWPIVHGIPRELPSNSYFLDEGKALPRG